MHIFDLITNTKTGKLSSEKLWFNLGNASLMYAFLVDVHLHELTEYKIGAYGAVVCGSGMAAKFLFKKYPPPQTQMIEPAYDLTPIQRTTL